MLKLVKTSSAKSKINSFFKKAMKEENIKKGKSILENNAKVKNLNLSKLMTNEYLEEVFFKYSFQNLDDMYASIGYGAITANQVLNKLNNLYKASNQEVLEPKEFKSTDIKNDGDIVVKGFSNMLTKLAKCCSPLPGDEIIGFVTKGFGVSIHKCDCPNVLNSKKDENNKDRWLEAYWDSSTSLSQSDMYEANLRVFVQDRIGILADISVALADMRVYILQINTTTDAEAHSIVNLKISCKNVEHYHSIVSRLRSVKGVDDVVRGFS